MVVVLVEMAIFVSTPFLWWSMDSFRPLNIRVVPYVNKYLLHRCIKGGVVQKITLGEVDSQSNSLAATSFSYPRTSIFLGCLLLLLLSFIMLQVGPNVESILDIHMLLLLHDEVG